MKKISAVFLGLFVVIAFAGCGSKTTTTQTSTYNTPDGKAEVKVETKKDRMGKDQTSTVEVKTAEGTAKVTSSNDPKAIKEAAKDLDVPIYPNAKPQATGEYQNPGGATGPGTFKQFQYITDDGYEDVVVFYKKKLKDVKTSYTGGADGNKTAMFMLGDGETSQTIIHIIYNAKAKKTTIGITKSGK